MEEKNSNPPRVRITVASIALIFTLLIPLRITDAPRGIGFSMKPCKPAAAYECLPADLSAALTLAHGNYARLVDMVGLIDDLQATDIVLIGEAHHDPRDMQTAFEIIQMLAEKRKVALAVERFPTSLQSSLDALSSIESALQRQSVLKRILQSEEYRTVWRPDSIMSPYLSNPSTTMFEEMIVWAVEQQIPIIGLDLPVTDRELGLGENIPFRNELWKDQIVNFHDRHQGEGYLVVAIGGIDHFSNAPNSVQDMLSNHPAYLGILSIGQRDANFASPQSFEIENLALKYNAGELIVQAPQFAVVKMDGIPVFQTPPDYWIAFHPVDH